MLFRDGMKSKNLESWICDAATISTAPPSCHLLNYEIEMYLKKKLYLVSEFMQLLEHFKKSIVNLNLEKALLSITE